MSTLHFQLRINHFETEDFDVYNQCRDLLLSQAKIKIGRIDKDYVKARQYLPTIDPETQEEIPPEGPFFLNASIRFKEKGAGKDKDKFDSLHTQVISFLSDTSVYSIDVIDCHHDKSQNRSCNLISHDEFNMPEEGI